jgi:hypothetical protein
MGKMAQMEQMGSGDSNSIIKIIPLYSKNKTTSREK